MNEFLKFVMYSVIGAVIFLGVYSFWDNPDPIVETFDAVKDTISEEVSEGKETNLDENPQNNQSNFVEFNLPYYSLPSCAFMEVFAESEGINKKEIKEAECTLRCGLDNKEFHHFECVIDKLHCYCEI